MGREERDKERATRNSNEGRGGKGRRERVVLWTLSAVNSSDECGDGVPECWSPRRWLSLGWRHYVRS